LWQKAGRARTAFGVKHIDVFVRDVVIAADHDAAAFVFHLHELRDEAIEKRFLHRLTRRTARARRRVERRDGKIVVEIHTHESALDVVFFHPEPAHDVRRLALRVDRDAAIAFLLRVDERRGELRRVDCLGRELMFLGFGFLQAHHVGVLREHPGKEAFAGRRADAVQIRRNYPEHARGVSP